MKRVDDPWYCPRCRTWVGQRLDACAGEGHLRPRLPLLYRDVSYAYARDVTRRDRLCAKLSRLRECLGQPGGSQ